MEDKASGRDKDGPQQDAASIPQEPAAMPLTDIKHPGENDVMFGRGGDTNYHIGNHRFRMLADEYCKQYHEASRKEKALIVQQVVSSWRGRNPSGRFLARTDPSLGEESLWHDVGTAVALKKAAKILSERSSEYRAGPSSRKRRAAPQREEPAREVHGTQAKLDTLMQDHPTFGSGGAFLQQRQPIQQPGFGRMQPEFGYQANYPAAQPAGFAAGFQGEAPHPAFAGVAVAGFPLVGMPGDDQRDLLQGSLTEHNLISAAAPPLDGDTDPSGSGTPGGRGVGRGTVQASSGSNQEVADDDSPGSIAQDSSAAKEYLPSAASLAGVFTSSSSDARGKDSSPSTDES